MSNGNAIILILTIQEEDMHHATYPYQVIPFKNPDRMKFALVRVYNSDKSQIVGGGFLATSWQVLTCAHVVEQATGQSAPILNNDVHVWIDFPYIIDCPLIRATVYAPHPANSNYDAAILSLESIIQGPIPVPLCVCEDNMLQKKITCIGFPGKIKEGYTAEGIIVGKNAKSWYQINETQIKNGFSGCPVWQNELGGVVGMIVNMVENINPGAAFFMPSLMLLQFWPETPLSWNGDIPGSNPFGRLRASNGILYNTFHDEHGQFLGV